MNSSGLRKYIMWILGIFVLDVAIALFFSILSYFILYFLIYSLVVGALIAKFHELFKESSEVFLNIIFMTLMLALIFTSIALPLGVSFEFLGIEVGNIPPMYTVFFRGFLLILKGGFLYIFILSIVVASIVSVIKR